MLLHSHSARAAARGALRTNRNSDRSKAFLSRLHRARVEPLESRHLLAVTVVTTTQDVLDPGDGLISLREAVIAANASPADDEIQLPAGTYLLTIQGNNEQAAQTGNLNLLNNGKLKIVGAGADTIVDGSGLYIGTPLIETLGGVFNVHSATVHLEGLTIRGGSAYAGGAISSDGIVTIEATAIVGNQSAVGGGAVHNRPTGVATLIESTVSENVGLSGVGIYNDGQMTVARSTISDNVATFLGTGAGIFNIGQLTIDSSTISGNGASNPSGVAEAGGILNSGTLALSNSTISGNAATFAAGGISNSGQLVSRHNRSRTIESRKPRVAAD